jgi:hypothetical protein
MIAKIGCPHLGHPIATLFPNASQGTRLPDSSTQLKSVIFAIEKQLYRKNAEWLVSRRIFCYQHRFIASLIELSIRTQG